MAQRLRPGSLTIVGTGIQLGQISLDARACLERADKVLFLVADPVTSGWLGKLNATAESLQVFYHPDKDRLLSYQEMVERILTCVRAGQKVCVAFYGHPGVYVFPAHEAVERARREGYPARMLPGISAEDCLFADLGIDPARTGCQSHDATDFLLCRRRVDTSSALILWQVGIVGELGGRTTSSRRGLRLLVQALLKYYPADHEAVLYEAAPFPLCRPRIRRVRLAHVSRARVTLASTLFIPAARPPSVDLKLVQRLRISRTRVTIIDEQPSQGEKCIRRSSSLKRGSARRLSQPGSTRRAMSKRSRSAYARFNQKNA
jgi:uncharacterized protein YabN with tetrapyrrole methylase and pyrophosphatase domain